MLLKCNQVIPEARRYDGSGPSRIKHKWDLKEPSYPLLLCEHLSYSLYPWLHSGVRDPLGQAEGEGKRLSVDHRWVGWRKSKLDSQISMYIQARNGQ